MRPKNVLSSSEAEGDVVKSYLQHANAYMTKPVDLGETTAILQLLAPKLERMSVGPEGRNFCECVTQFRGLMNATVNGAHALRKEANT